MPEVDPQSVEAAILAELSPACRTLRQLAHATGFSYSALQPALERLTGNRLRCLEQGPQFVPHYYFDDEVLPARVSVRILSYEEIAALEASGQMKPPTPYKPDFLYSREPAQEEQLLPDDPPMETDEPADAPAQKPESLKKEKAMKPGYDKQALLPRFTQLLKEGKDLNQIAALTGVHQSTLSKWTRTDEAYIAARREHGAHITRQNFRTRTVQPELKEAVQAPALPEVVAGPEFSNNVDGHAALPFDVLRKRAQWILRAKDLLPAFVEVWNEEEEGANPLALTIETRTDELLRQIAGASS